LKMCPAIDINPTKVSDIKEEAWEVMMRDYQKTIDEMKHTMEHNKQEFERIMAEEKARQAEALATFEKKQQEVAAKHKEEMDSVRNQLIAMQNRPSGSCCFPANATCILANGELCKLSEVKEGQEVYSVDVKGNVVLSEVYFVDGESGPTPMCHIIYKDQDQNQKSLVATPEHLIYASPEKCSISKLLHIDAPVTAKTIKAGHFIYVLENGKIECHEVLNVKTGYAEGRWSVLTLQHRLFVENALVSAYEINQTWGIADTLIMRGLYAVAPSFVTSPANKWFCKQYDMFFEPIAKGFRDLFQ